MSNIQINYIKLTNVIWFKLGIVLIALVQVCFSLAVATHFSH